MISEGLIDKILLSVTPVKLGGGIELFKCGNIPASFRVAGSKDFDTGLVQHKYELIV